MRKYISLFFILFLLQEISSGQMLSVVPRPLKEIPGKGNFILEPHTIIYTNKRNEQTAIYLQKYLDSFYHVVVKIKNSAPPNAGSPYIILLSPMERMAKESYSLLVTQHAITITGKPAGVFYGVQSLLQLLSLPPSVKIQVPCVDITDKPRFGWRGLSLDVSRHFFSVPEVKKYIDLMAHYKLNVFHWHLTDDEGWRIQIEKYPLLTAVGSKMNVWAKEGKFRPLSNIVDGGSEGFYTKEEIKEVVQYARERFITTVPEIEMPGHCEAAVYAYPELGCQDSTGEKQKQKPFARTRMYDPSEKTFAFLEDVLTECMEMFPGIYFHIGGDEAEMTDWLKSPAAIALMKKEKLKNEKEIQSYFIKRIEKFLLSKGKKLVGWDEILEGGLAPSATVMSWRGEEGGIAAAKMHHPVVMTPLPYVYFDAPQSDDTLEPVGWNYPLSWQHVYSYEPESLSLSPREAKYILGAQANIWAEKIPSLQHLEYMVYPRALALSEVCWTDKNRKSLLTFTHKLNRQYELLDLWKVNARMPDVEGMQVLATNNKSTLLKLSHPIENTRINYTTDGSVPNQKGALYEKPVLLQLPDTGKIKVKILAFSFLGKQERYQTKEIRRVMPVASSVDRKKLKPGLWFGLYRKDTDFMESNTKKAERSSTLRSLKLPGINISEGFHSLAIKGYLVVNKETDYRFVLLADGESVFQLDNQEVINNEGYHGTVPKEVVLHLKRGLYAFQVDYHNEDIGKELKLTVNTKNGLRVKPVWLNGENNK